MARVQLVFEDQFDENTPLKEIGVKFSMTVDRSGDPAETAPFPATPAMLFAHTAHRLFESGTLETLIGFVTHDLMAKAGLTAEQRAECEKRALEKMNGDV